MNNTAFTGELEQYPLGTRVRTLPCSYVKEPNEVLTIVGLMGIIDRNTQGGHGLPPGPIQAYELGRKSTIIPFKMNYVGAVYHDMIIPVDITEPFSKKTL